MVFDVNWVAGLVAGVAAMVPGAIIYSPAGFARQWAKSIGKDFDKMQKEGSKKDAQMAVGKQFVTSLVNGLAAAVLVGLTQAETVADTLVVTSILTWFWISASLMLVYFENRNWMWFKISALSHILTMAVIGVILGLFL